MSLIDTCFAVFVVIAIIGVLAKGFWALLRGRRK